MSWAEFTRAVEQKFKAVAVYPVWARTIASLVAVEQKRYLSGRAIDEFLVHGDRVERKMVLEKAKRAGVPAAVLRAAVKAGVDQALVLTGYTRESLETMDVVGR